MYFFSGENTRRRQQISMGKQEVSLEEEYKKYKEQQRIRKELVEDFDGIEYKGLIVQMI